MNILHDLKKKLVKNGYTCSVKIHEQKGTKYPEIHELVIKYPVNCYFDVEIKVIAADCAEKLPSNLEKVFDKFIHKKED